MNIKIHPKKNFSVFEIRDKTGAIPKLMTFAQKKQPKWRQGTLSL